MFPLFLSLSPGAGNSLSNVMGLTLNWKSEALVSRIINTISIINNLEQVISLHLPQFLYLQNKGNNAYHTGVL